MVKHIRLLSHSLNRESTMESMTPMTLQWQAESTGRGRAYLYRVATASNASPVPDCLVCSLQRGLQCCSKQLLLPWRLLISSIMFPAGLRIQISTPVCTLYLLTPTHTLSLPVESQFLPPIPLFPFPFHLVIPMSVHMHSTHVLQCSVHNQWVCRSSAVC